LADELRALLPPGSAARRSVEERRGGALAGAVTFSVPLTPAVARRKGKEADAVNSEEDACGLSEARRLARRAVLRLRTATRVLELLGEADLDPRRAAGDTVYDAVRRFEEQGDEDEEEQQQGRRRRHNSTSTSSPVLRRGGSGGWASLLQGPGSTLATKAQLWGNSNVSNSQLVAKRVRDACLDAVREATGTRPPPAPPGSGTADLPLVAILARDRLSVYRDWSGGSLHRRGYRAGAPVHRAALNEAAAAALLAAAGWWDPLEHGKGVVDEVLSGGGGGGWGGGEGGVGGRGGGDSGLLGKTTGTLARLALLDPMCGSGTMLVEAALVAVRAAPGLVRWECAADDEEERRAHAFERWPDHDAALWRAELDEARRERDLGERAWRAAAAAAAGTEPNNNKPARRGRPPKAAAAAAATSTAPPATAPPLLLGADLDDRALSLARHAARRAGVADLIRWHLGDCSERQGQALAEAIAAGGGTSDAPPHLAVANPPWGVRLLPWEEGGGEEEDHDDGFGFGREQEDEARGFSGADAGRQAESAAQATWDDLRVALKAAAAVGGDPDAVLRAWVLSGNDKLSLGLRSERKRALLAGGRKLTWLGFLVRPARAAAPASS
jgi:23S rRNA G2445 N2-methylase RlmL